MNAADVLRAARAAGVHISVDGNDLLLEARLPPPPALLDKLLHYKPGILALLTHTQDEWSEEDWKTFFEERAAINEFDGGDAGTKAEERAFECCLAEWLDRHPEPSTPDCCAWCGTPNQSGHVVVPFGVSDRGLTWLHPECWRGWYRQRRLRAEEALAALGVRRPSSASWDDQSALTK